MAEIPPSMVRELREKSGAGMMECKRALQATGGDLEAAFDELRKAGLKTADKKAGRATGEGRLAQRLSDDGTRGAMVAIACETDFVAKTPDFEGFLKDLGDHVYEHAPADVEACLAQKWQGSDDTVGDALKGLIGKLGENILIAQVQAYHNPKGLTAAYVHHDQKQGALVNVTTGADKDVAAATLKTLCMHIVSRQISPVIGRDSISADLVEREKAIIKEGLAGKPEEIQEKIMAGRLEKFFGERVIGDQPWIMDDSTTVTKALTAALGDGTQLEDFAHFHVGG